VAFALVDRRSIAGCPRGFGAPREAHRRGASMAQMLATALVRAHAGVRFEDLDQALGRR
jgi:hypothetical protein